jgi:alpha-galactosidase
MDGELLSHAHVNWVSDQPGPLRKLAIHFGTQLAHPAVVCNDWLIEWPPGRIAGYDDDEDSVGLDDRCDLPFRLRVAMLGSFGISAAIDRWPEADLVIAAEHVALYRNKLRSIIHHGNQYFLTPPPIDGSGDWAAIWYVAKDGSNGVLFAFRLGGGEGSRSFPLPAYPRRRAIEQAFSLWGASWTQLERVWREASASLSPDNFSPNLSS